MIVKHTREILVGIFPKILKYEIPLWLPTEKQILKAHTLVLEVAPHVMPQQIVFEELAKMQLDTKSLRVELR